MHALRGLDCALRPARQSLRSCDRPLLLAAVALALSIPDSAAATPRSERRTAAVAGQYQVNERHGLGIHVGGPSVAAAKAVGDTFYLYGGPSRYPQTPEFNPEGKFETATGTPDRQGWVGVDATQSRSYWHISTFNAPLLPATAPAWWLGDWSVPAPNHAMWCGVDASAPGYSTAPGYGNLWDDPLDLRLPAPDPQQATTVGLALLFNHDTEENYDFFTVAWDSAGTMHPIASFDGDNRDGMGQFSMPVELIRSFTYEPGEYAGGTDLHLRLLFQSDGVWSDEDGGYPSDGAVQIDAVQVRANGEVASQTAFEGGDAGGWAPEPAPYCGDFSKVLLLLTDLDACRDNPTPQMTFIDNGTPPNNDPLGRSTGGSLSPTWNYGVPGHWVVNYTGGLSGGQKSLYNEVWSPAIAWDLPGPQDDGAHDGALLRFDTWRHLPFVHGMLAFWHVRSFPDPQTGWWSQWEDRAFAYDGLARWENVELFVRDLLVAEPESVQIALGVGDFADVFQLPGNDATPAPTYDNVAFLKFEAATPTIVGREIDWFQDAFPQSGVISCTTADDGALAIRLDMARDIRPTGVPNNVPGDSVYADFTVNTPGLELDPASVRLEFVLDANACFAAERAAGLAALQAGAGSGASDVQPIGATRYRGYVRGVQAVTAGGDTVHGRYFFDLPDGPVTLAAYQTPEPALFFPADRLRYYFAASTAGGAASAILPPDTSGFSHGVGYNRTWQVTGLPTLTCGETDTSPCTQPTVLAWNDFGHRGGEEELMQAFSQNGLFEFWNFDTYTTSGPSSGVGNGLGSAGVHGASAAQLAGYRCLVYDCGDLTTSLISDGSNTLGNDKSDDVGVLTAWFGQEGDRAAVYFGDNIAAGLQGGGATFRTGVMGIGLVATDVRSSIGNQTAPRIGPTTLGAALGFATTYVAYGGCLAINNFDEVGPTAVGAATSHEFLTPEGTGGVYTPSAGAYYAREDTIAGQPYTRTNVTFPHGFSFVYDVTGGAGNPAGRSARASLVRELLVAFGHADLLAEPTPGVPVPAGRRLRLAQNHPNPFNPSTTVQLEVPQRGHVRVRIYNLRGELVATLLDEVVPAASLELEWRGVDANGVAVASGVYVCRAEGFEQTRTIRMVLLR